MDTSELIDKSKVLLKASPRLYLYSIIEQLLNIPLFIIVLLVFWQQGHGLQLFSRIKLTGSQFLTILGVFLFLFLINSLINSYFTGARLNYLGARYTRKTTTISEDFAKATKKSFSLWKADLASQGVAKWFIARNLNQMYKPTTTSSKYIDYKVKYSGSILFVTPLVFFENYNLKDAIFESFKLHGQKFMDLTFKQLRFGLVNALAIMGGFFGFFILAGLFPGNAAAIIILLIIVGIVLEMILFYREHLNICYNLLLYYYAKHNKV